MLVALWQRSTKRLWEKSLGLRSPFVKQSEKSFVEQIRKARYSTYIKGSARHSHLEKLHPKYQKQIISSAPGEAYLILNQATPFDSDYLVKWLRMT